jgi:hypothetical protein
MAPASHTYCTFVAYCEASEAQYYCWEHVLQVPGWLQFDANFMAEKKCPC